MSSSSTGDAAPAHVAAGQVAAISKKRGIHPSLADYIRKTYGLRSLQERLHDAGLLTIRRMERKFRVAPDAIKRWRARGLVRGRVFNDKGEYMYEDPGNDARVRRAAKHAARVRPGCAGLTRILREECSMRRGPCRAG